MGKKTLRIPNVSGYDTRGLPFGMDPRKFYEYSAQQRRQSATGIEKFLYELMPYNLIGSLAFAVDPLSQFKVSATRISPATRTRTRTTMSVLDPRSFTAKFTAKVAPYKYLPGGYTDGNSQTYVQPAQLGVPHVSHDVVKSDRLLGSEMGEFSMWKAQTFSPPRSVRFHENQRRWYNDSPSGYNYIFTKEYERTGHGPAAYIQRSDVDALRGEVQGKQLAVMQANVLGLYRRCSSQKRATTLFRNIVELKDLPRGILQLQESYRHLRELAFNLNIPANVLRRIHLLKTTSKDVPKEFLSYSFGWRQLYSDTMDLLLAPERISKRVNFLIRRNGKATTYRSQQKIAENYATTSGFTYYTFPDESVKGNDSNITIDHELKMVINATFEFPDVNVPTLRQKEFYRQMGVVPTPLDVYNLVPWSWLFDWFTGFGKYLEVIESINTDKELVNWGVLSCVSKGKLQTTFSGKVQNADTVGDGPTVFTYPVSGHTSVLEFKSHLRRDVSGMLNVRTTGDPSSLSTYQLSILGALLAGRLKF
jgi:hypothetical protein